MVHEKYTVIGVTLVVLLVAGCGGPAAPPVSEAPTPDREATQQAAILATQAAIVATHTAQPTDTPTPEPPTPTPKTGPKAGDWKGEGVSFEVTSDGHVRNFSIDIRMSSGNTCSLTSEGEVVIGKDGTFAFNDTTESISGKTVATNLVSGRFDSDTTLIGSYGSTMILCNKETTMFIKEKEWSANWSEP
jgi:hypothetical protein